MHLQPNTGFTHVQFEVRIGQCGLLASGNLESNGQPNPAGSYLENTIIVQYDPQVNTELINATTYVWLTLHFILEFTRAQRKYTLRIDRKYVAKKCRTL